MSNRAIDSDARKRCALPGARHRGRYVSLMRNLLAIGVVVLTSVGCIPLPHFEQHSPYVAGTLRKSGNAEAGAEVRLTLNSGDSICATPEKVVITDQNGEFTLQGIKSFGLFLPVLGEPLHSWTVCVLSGGRTYHGLTSGGVGFAPEAVKLRCAITS